jgi:hypothetical protein
MSRTVTVNVIGMAEKDCRMIRNVLSLASTKEQSYRLVIDGRERAEVIMVNADDPAAMAFWNEYRQIVPEANTILASVTPMFDSDYLFIKRPLIASQLHGVLTLDCAWAPPPKQQKYEALKKSFLFRNFSTAHLEKIMGLAKTMTLPADQIVFEKSNTGDEMFVVLSGRLKISVTNREGREIVLGVVGTGQIVGEIAMLDGRGRSANATTLTPCELLLLHRKDFMPFLEQNPKVAMDLLTMLALRLRLNTEQLAEVINEQETPH